MSAEKITIPQHHIDVCKEIGRLCRAKDVTKFSGSFTPPFRDPWSGDISFTWEQGRHGEDSDRITLISQIYVREHLGPDKS